MAEFEQKGKALIYDKAMHHFKGDFPEILPIEQAYVHIGMYLGWVIKQKLYSEYFEEEAETQIFRFNRKEILCTILSETWDGYLGDELFSDEGNAFTTYYYQGGIYLKDYNDVLVKELPSVYHVTDSWENFDLLSSRLTQRLKEWQESVQ
ncbi:MAG: hypothetical protein V4714_22205 [Bacteroidota bacterium]